MLSADAKHFFGKRSTKCPMSALGHFQNRPRVTGKSALLSEADIISQTTHVRKVPQPEDSCSAAIIVAIRSHDQILFFDLGGDKCPPAWSLLPCAAMNMATADRQ